MRGSTSGEGGVLGGLVLDVEPELESELEDEDLWCSTEVAPFSRSELWAMLSLRWITACRRENFIVSSYIERLRLEDRSDMFGSSYPQYAVDGEISEIRSDISEAIANRHMRPHLSR